ncbi:MAG: hypothetical protein ACOYBM_07380 [Dethiobacteria bacterium]|nr:hypothetical protein [Bacillota bacterium]
MSKTVLGIFRNRDGAENALSELKAQGFEDDISLVAKDDREQDQDDTMTMENQDLTEGSVTGGALGGLAGWLAGAGALLIPGVGPIIAAGPLAAALTGVVAGGVAGGLVDYGIPEERGRYYEEQVKQGGILLSVKTSDSKAEDAAAIMRDNGAQDVETH